MTFWGIFPREVKVIIFAWRGACEVCLKRTSENSELGKLKFLFWVEGSIGGCGRVGVWIRSWGQGVGVWNRSWGQSVWGVD